MRILAGVVVMVVVGCGGSSRTRTDAGPGVDSGRSDSGPRDGGPRFDSSVDSGVVCPADIGSAEGMPCSSEGAYCGGDACTDACSFCNIIQCERGTWQRVEAFPAPCFDCGDSLRCVQDDQFCRVTRSDVGGVPDGYACEAHPSECAGMATCACLEMYLVFDRCTEETPGQVTIEHFGG